DCATGRCGDAFGVFTWRLRPRGLAEARLFELLDQEIDGALDDDGEISIHVRVAHQIGGAFELLPQLVARGELHLVTCGRERSDLRRRRYHRWRGWRRRERDL